MSLASVQHLIGDKNGNSLLLRLAGVAAAAVAGLTVAGAAVAADATTDAAGLQEIVVTVTRHEEGISRVPLSISAFSQEAIDQKGIKDINDVVRFTPGLSIDNSGTNAISIRGISSCGGAGMTVSGWNLSMFVDNLLDSRTTTNYLFGVVDPYNPAVAPGPLYSNFTFRPRSVGVTATFRK